MWKVTLSEFMLNLDVIRPPDEGFHSYYGAYSWVLKHYGSTAIDSIVAGQDVGCHILEEVKGGM